MKYDVTQLEINPLAKTNRGVISVDAKVLVDDNASFRQVIDGMKLSVFRKVEATITCSCRKRHLTKPLLQKMIHGK